MQILKRIFFWSLIILIFISAGIYVYMRTNGRPLLEKSMSELLGRKFHVRSINFFFPFSVSLDHVEIEGILKTKKIKIDLEWPFFAGQELVISRLRLHEPVFKLRRDRSSQIFVDDLASPGGKPGGPSNEKLAAGLNFLTKNKRVFVKNLDIQGAELTLVDEVIEKTEIYNFKNLSIHMRGVPYPLKSQDIGLEISGDFFKDDMMFSGGHIDAQGKVNWIKKDMDVQLSGMDPKAGLKLSANLKSVNNDLRVNGKIQVLQNAGKNTFQNFKDVSSGELVLGFLQSLNLEADIGFNFKTTMDHFKAEEISLSGNVVYQDAGQSPSPQKADVNQKQNQEGQ